MRASLMVLSAIAAAVTSIAASPSSAKVVPMNNIAVDQWYTGSFENFNPAFLRGGENLPTGSVLGTDGPILGGGKVLFAPAKAAPGAFKANPVPWVIDLKEPGTLTVVDLQFAGDQFKMMDNGGLMKPGVSPFNLKGQNPGNAAVGAKTSAPADGPFLGIPSIPTDINAALGNTNFSSGTFILPAGVNSIAGMRGGFPDNAAGVFSFIAEGIPASVPEPATWAMMLLGFAGLVFARYRIRASAASV